MELIRSVVLSGMMGSGKTTVGRRLAERLRVEFVDVDAQIEAAVGCTIAEYWRREGEEAFREAERSASREFLLGPPRVIALGGGAVVDRQTRHLAAGRSLLVTLRAGIDTLAQRLSDDTSRPKIAVRSGDLPGRVAQLMADRAAAYAECHLSIGTDDLSVDDVVDRICLLIDRDPLLVPLGERSYAIDIGADCAPRLTDALRAIKPTSLVIVSDSNVKRAQRAAIALATRAVDVPVVEVTLAAGEEHKSLASVAAIWDAALGANVDRKSVVVAFGGGVVGDLAGFAASTLLRGVRCVQVPTSLLAMVDSSVGGKTGFDHPVGKNLVGAFHHPSAVVIDLEYLKTLPARERIAGLAEVVKVALVLDAQLFEMFEKKAERVAAGGETTLLEPIVRRAVSAKIGVVRDDEREQGVRGLLNFGHTVGHALEAYGGYTRYKHGEAVAIGMLAEMAAAVRLGLTAKSALEQTRAVLERCGLPTHVEPKELRAAWAFVSSDKKRDGATLNLPIVGAVGEGRIERIEMNRFRDALL